MPKVGRNDHCPCGSGKKFKKCCGGPKLPQPPSPGAPPIQDEGKTAFLFKPVQFFGVTPLLPTAKPGYRGALVQFVIPGLKVGKDSASDFTRIARLCGEEVQAARLDRVHSEQGKHPATFVSITYHVSKELAPEEHHAEPDVFERTGRLIAERYLSLLTFAVGERLIGVSQQVHVVMDDGNLSAKLHPQSKRADKPRSIELPKALIGAQPSEKVFKALYWLRRGLRDQDHLDTYAALMVALEILASALLPPETTISKCPHCAGEIGKLSRSSVKKLVTEQLGGTVDQFKKMWTIRNSITAHGGRAVTADVLQEVVELKLDAIDYVFRGLRLAMGLEKDGPPRPAPLVMMTDPFLAAE